MEHQNQPDQSETSQEQPVAQTPPVSETPSPAPVEASPTTSSPKQPIKPQTRNWKKWIIIGGGILVVLLTGTAYVLSQQKSQKQEIKTVTQPTVEQPSPALDPTADWKTYANEKYGYSFKYPQTWSVSVLNDFLENPDPQFPDAGAMQSICTGPNSCPFNFGIYKGSVEEKTSEFTKNNTNQDPSFIISITDTTDHGLSGKKIVTKGTQAQTPGIHYYYAKNGYVYIIDAVDIAGGNNPIEIYNQAVKILQTFKFTEQSERFAHVEKEIRRDLGYDDPEVLYVEISKISGNYAAIGVGATNGNGGGRQFLIKTNGKWTPLWSGQFDPYCSEMIDKQIPKEIYLECK